MITTKSDAKVGTGSEIFVYKNNTFNPYEIEGFCYGVDSDGDKKWRSYVPEDRYASTQLAHNVTNFAVSYENNTNSVFEFPIMDAGQYSEWTGKHGPMVVNPYPNGLSPYPLGLYYFTSIRAPRKQDNIPPNTTTEEYYNWATQTVNHDIKYNENGKSDVYGSLFFGTPTGGYNDATKFYSVDRYRSSTTSYAEWTTFYLWAANWNWYNAKIRLETMEPTDYTVVGKYVLAFRACQGHKIVHASVGLVFGVETKSDTIQTFVSLGKMAPDKETGADCNGFTMMPTTFVPEFSTKTNNSSYSTIHPTYLGESGGFHWYYTYNSTHQMNDLNIPTTVVSDTEWHGMYLVPFVGIKGFSETDKDHLYLLTEGIDTYGVWDASKKTTTKIKIAKLLLTLYTKPIE